MLNLTCARNPQRSHTGMEFTPNGMVIFGTNPWIVYGLLVVGAAIGGGAMYHRGARFEPTNDLTDILFGALWGAIFAALLLFWGIVISMIFGGPIILALREYLNIPWWLAITTGLAGGYYIAYLVIWKPFN